MSGAIGAISTIWGYIPTSAQKSHPAEEMRRSESQVYKEEIRYDENPFNKRVSGQSRRGPISACIVTLFLPGCLNKSSSISCLYNKLEGLTKKNKKIFCLYISHAKINVLNVYQYAICTVTIMA